MVEFIWVHWSIMCFSTMVYMLVNWVLKIGFLCVDTYLKSCNTLLLSLLSCWFCFLWFYKYVDCFGMILCREHIDLSKWQNDFVSCGNVQKKNVRAKVMLRVIDELKSIMENAKRMGSNLQNKRGWIETQFIWFAMNTVYRIFPLI